ncbi:MAG TPA: hypothetical protein VG604_01215 [Candidatus Saccharimonadales bacterium]|nr:hypothetical protein [Candidatus Saccharimonadales bacterium]
MKSFVVGVAGGSGSGKSTLAFGLCESLPSKVMIFHMDDYFRPADEIPKRAGMPNWDDPRSLYYSKMAKDLADLKAGKSVTINTKSPDLNPDFLRTGQRIPVKFNPQPVIIVEGFLALYYPKIRKLLDLSVYLDAPFQTHVERRIHSSLRLGNFPPDYRRLVLRPMHDRYVAPSKVQADVVVNVAKLNQKQVLDKVTPLIAARIT